MTLYKRVVRRLGWGHLEHSTEMCSGSEAGSYLRRIDSCITQLKAQGPSGTCNESQEEEEVGVTWSASSRVGTRTPGDPNPHPLGSRVGTRTTPFFLGKLTLYKMGVGWGHLERELASRDEGYRLVSGFGFRV